MLFPGHAATKTFQAGARNGPKPCQPLAQTTRLCQSDRRACDKGQQDGLQEDMLRPAGQWPFKGALPEHAS